MSCSPSSSSTPSSISLWASLPSDILELLVTSLQSSFDRLRFGAVCRSWRDVSAAVRQNPRGTGGCNVATLPIMTYIEPAVDEVKGGPLSAAAATSATRCFYSLSEDKVYRRQVPPQPRWSRFFGSSCGWLGMVDLGLNTFLFDPVSGARVDLPSLTTLTRLFPKKRKSVDRATAYNIIDEEPDDIFRRRCPRTAINARDKYINRLALSSSPLDDPNCIVMSTVSGYHLLAYTRPGDVSWVELPDLRSDSLHFGDIIYHDGDRRFYASSFFGETIAIDFEISKSPAAAAAKPLQPRSDFVRPVVETIVPRAIVGFRICAAELYLVALPSGEIARVTRYAGRNPYCRTKAFKIHKLKYLVGGGGGAGDDPVQGRWVDVVNYVGGCCVFVGLNESMAVPALEVLGQFRTNCIFFNDGCGESYIREYSHGHGCTPDFGIFDLEKDTAGILRRIDARPRPMWISL